MEKERKKIGKREKKKKIAIYLKFLCANVYHIRVFGYSFIFGVYFIEDEKLYEKKKSMTVEDKKSTISLEFNAVDEDLRSSPIPRIFKHHMDKNSIPFSFSFASRQPITKSS